MTLRATIHLSAIIAAMFANPALAKPRYDGPPGESFVYKASDGRERRMEVYFPPDHDPATAKVPGMILFHGGGWQGGGLDQFRFACDYFARRGLVCATVEYRMLGREAATLPENESKKRVCITDAKSAIRWFKQQSGKFGIDPDRVITGGGSAGAHISALATMNPGLNDPADSKDVDTRVVAYVWFNPAFTAADAKDPEVDVLNHIKPGLPPAIVIFGDRDVWLPGWTAAHAKWKALSAGPVEFWIAKNQKHGFFNREPWRSVTLIEVDRFLGRHGLLTGEPTMEPPAGNESLALSGRD